MSIFLNEQFIGYRKMINMLEVTIWLKTYSKDEL